MFSNVKCFTFENILHPNKWSISTENDYILHFALCSLWFRLFYFIFISRRTKGGATQLHRSMQKAPQETLTPPKRKYRII